MALLTIPLVFKLPPLTEFSEVLGEDVRRRTVWFDAPAYSPHFWNVLALATLALVGMAMAYVMAIPDFAAIRDHGTGWKQRWGKKLARGFHGSSTQWEWLRMRIGITGALYFATLLFVHFTFSLDFAVSLVPGWKDSVFVWVAVGTLASLIVALIVKLTCCNEKKRDKIDERVTGKGNGSLLNNYYSFYSYFKVKVKGDYFLHVLY